jgi:plasmid stabilization system protein ParE
MKQVWTVRLGQQAEQDYVEILQWTVKTFGEGQANNYAETIALAIEALEGGPDVLGARARETSSQAFGHCMSLDRGARGDTLWCSVRPDRTLTS